MNPRHLAFVVILLVLGARAAWREGALYSFAMTTVSYHRDLMELPDTKLHNVVLEHRTSRWNSRNRVLRVWSESTGRQVDFFEVQRQPQGSGRADDVRLSLQLPPAPWVLAGKTVDEWWDCLPAHMKDD